MRPASIKKLLVSLVLPQLAGAVGAVFTADSVSTWYVGVNKPFFNPPNWVFGPVWTTLYLLMGISFYLVWIENQSKKQVVALRLFLIQLGLNTLWSIFFFGLQSPKLAFAEIIFFLAAIILTAKKFYPLSRPAAYLLVPYLCWVTFAGILNLSTVLLN